MHLSLTNLIKRISFNDFPAWRYYNEQWWIINARSVNEIIYAILLIITVFSKYIWNMNGRFMTQIRDDLTPFYLAAQRKKSDYLSIISNALSNLILLKICLK